MPRSVTEHLDPALHPSAFLSLDGAGRSGSRDRVSGEVESLLAARSSDPHFRLCHYFDLIGGTSTGAIIATALALGMTAAEIRTLLPAGESVFRRPFFRIWGVRPASTRAVSQGAGRGAGQSPLESLTQDGLAIIAKRLDRKSW